jgi:hypothetical protein
MADVKPQNHLSESPPAEWEAGGLRFAVSFREPAGATFLMSGPVGGAPRELVRFDDFVDSPHYHVPGDADPIPFDRATLGEPLDWLVHQIRDHLDELLTTGGCASVLPQLDPTTFATSAERVRAAMIACVPTGYVRVPGVGLQRTGTPAS